MRRPLRRHPLLGMPLVVAVLGAGVMATALGVVYAKFESRKLFVELQSLHQERDAMNVEWGQLQLEQSTWAMNARVEKIAHERLHMSVPDAKRIQIVVMPATAGAAQ